MTQVMRPTAHVFIATSLDGFIARPDGSLDWLAGFSALGEDHGYDAFIAGMDGIVMGRGTYETVLGFDEWPYRLPVVVLSRQPDGQAIPSQLTGKVRFSAVAPPDLLAELGAQGWRRVYVDGGQIVQAILRDGLVTDLTISRIPVLIGHGRALFGDLGGDVGLDHLETRSFPSGLVQSRYRIRPVGL